MRLSARTVVFSLESSPGFASPVRWFALLRAVLAAVAPVGLETRVVPPCPRAAAFWLPFAEDFDDGALPMRSFIMSATSSASAYLRRYTFTTVSGVVSTSSCLMTFSKKS